jgi:plastocyanin
MLKSKFLIIILVCSVFAGWLSWLYFGPTINNKATVSGGNMNAETGTVIIMSDDGFEPTTLNIKVGDTVKFINKSKYWHWPASDLHPTHTLYPEFDPRKPVGPGEVWEFTFEKKGNWHLHDHLSPYVTGKIIVEE